MSTLYWVAGIGVVIALALVAYFNRKTGADVDGDGDVDLQDAKIAVEKTVAGTTAAVKETKKRAKAVAVEAKDVVDALAEAVDQSKDVVAAAKGKKRTGPKKTTAKKPAAKKPAAKK